MTSELLRTRIIDLTVEDLVGIIDNRLSEVIKHTNPTVSAEKYARSIKELAYFLGVSTRKINRIKSTGVIDDAITQCGRMIIIDKERALELIKLNKLI